jgi:hypothetical protein
MKVHKKRYHNHEISTLDESEEKEQPQPTQLSAIFQKEPFNILNHIIINIIFGINKLNTKNNKKLNIVFTFTSLKNSEIINNPTNNG